MKSTTIPSVLLLALFLLTACSKNKDEITPSLVGKWQYITVTTTISAGGKSQTETGNYATQDASYVFGGDGTYTQRTPDSTATGGVTKAIKTGVYKLAGNQITFTVDDPTTKLKLNRYALYSQNGNDLTLTLNKELILKSLNEFQTASPDPLTLIIINAVKAYDTYNVTLIMRKQ